MVSDKRLISIISQSQSQPRRSHRIRTQSQVMNSQSYLNNHRFGNLMNSFSQERIGDHDIDKKSHDRRKGSSRFLQKLLKADGKSDSEESDDEIRSSKSIQKHSGNKSSVPNLKCILKSSENYIDTKKCSYSTNCTVNLEAANHLAMFNEKLAKDINLAPNHFIMHQVLQKDLSSSLSITSYLVRLIIYTFD